MKENMTFKSAEDLRKLREEKQRQMAAARREQQWKKIAEQLDWLFSDECDGATSVDVDIAIASLDLELKNELKRCGWKVIERANGAITISMAE